MRQVYSYHVSALPQIAFRSESLKYWEIIANNLTKRGWSWGLATVRSVNGSTIFVADVHGDDGKRFVVRSDELLTAFLELERAIIRAEQLN